MENSSHKNHRYSVETESPLNTGMMATLNPESAEKDASGHQPIHPLPAPEGGDENTPTPPPSVQTKSGAEKNMSAVLSLEQGLPAGLIFFYTGIQIQREIDEVSLRKVVSKLQAITGFSIWAFADLLCYCDAKDFTQARRDVMQATGWSDGRLATFIRVAKAFPIERRNRKLTFDHHEAIVANLPRGDDSTLWDQTAAEWLRLAEENSWSAKALRERLGGPRLRQRQLTLLGFIPKTKLGQKLAAGMRPWIEKQDLNERDVGYAEDVLDDIEKLKEYFHNRLHPDPDTTTPSPSLERTNEAFEAAMKDIEAGMPFKEAANKHGLTQPLLGRRRLEEAAKLKKSGANYAAIYRKLGVKRDKLVAFLNKTEPAIANGHEEEASPSTIKIAAAKATSSGNLCPKASLSCAAGLELALAAIRNGDKLFEAARQHSVEIPCLIAYRRAKAEANFAETGSVSQTATALRMDYKDLRSHLKQRGLLTQRKEGN